MGPALVLAPPPWGVIPPPAALVPPPRSRIGLSQTLQGGQAALTTAPPRIPAHPLWLWPRPRGPHWPRQALRPPSRNGRAADARGETRAGGGEQGAGLYAAACGWAWRGYCWHGRPAPRGPRTVRGDRAATRIWRATCAGGASSPPTSSCVWIPAAACRAPAGATALTVSSRGRCAGAGVQGR